MIEKTFYFLGGLPRSGSTVLASLLNQNPSVYATPTSPMLDLLANNQKVWESLPITHNQTQLNNLTFELINATWKHIPQNIIIDKHRGWCANMPAAKFLFGKDIKTIVTVRDLPSIMASWLTILKISPDNFLDKMLVEQGETITDNSRVDKMWECNVKSCYESLMTAFMQAKTSQILLIDYDILIEKPNLVLGEIQEFLELPVWEYSIENITSNSIDDDLVAWGIDTMHKIRPVLKKTSKSPEIVLGEELFDKYKNIDQSFWKEVTEMRQ